MLQRAREGDSESWQQLAHLYGPIVYGWARRCGCQPADAADVMQETFSSVAKALSRFDHDRKGATFRGWLWTITRNKINDWRRAEVKGEDAIGGTDAHQAILSTPNPEKEASPDSENPPTDAAIDAATVRGRMVGWLRDRFDPRTWKMFWETAVENRDAAAVAEEMSVSRWAVYKAKARVLQRLKQELEGLE